MRIFPRNEEPRAESNPALHEMPEPPGRLGEIVRRLKRRVAADRAAEILPRSEED